MGNPVSARNEFFEVPSRLKSQTALLFLYTHLTAYTPCGTYPFFTVRTVLVIPGIIVKLPCLSLAMTGSALVSAFANLTLSPILRSILVLTDVSIPYFPLLLSAVLRYFYTENTAQSLCVHPVQFYASRSAFRIQKINRTGILRQSKSKFSNIAFYQSIGFHQ